MGLLAQIRSRKIIARVIEREMGYKQPLAHEQRLTWQLEQVNRNWAVQQANIPAYISAVQNGRLPTRFASMREFCDKVAPTTKKMVQTRMNDLSDPTRPQDCSFSTGGSTGEPTTFPFWNSESEHSIPDRWMCRRWYDVEPSDRLFIIWGHSHLLGTGFKGKLKGRLRVWKDSALGYRRFSAYQLDPAKLRHAADDMLRFRPDYMLCYSSALDYFCRVNADRADEFKKLNLKMAVGTGESFPFPDSPQWVNRTLGCRVAMEYGSIEAGILGFSRPAAQGLGHFDLCWRSYFIEANEVGPTGGRVIRLTSLFPRKFPLLRYEIGDEVSLFEGDDDLGLTRVQKILGRSLGFVTMPDGTRFHGAALTQSVFAVPGVQRFQFVSSGGTLTLKVVAPGGNQDAITKGIRTWMDRIHPSLAEARIEFTDKLLQTVAGKTPIVVMEESHLANDAPGSPR